jgi:LPXTG-motif cell wall-anchored protein
VRKLFAVAMTAALLLPAAGTAAAQEEKIFIGGLVWFDRNSDTKLNPIEPGVPNEKIIKIVKQDTGELVGEYTTDEKGMYSARDLPKAKYVVTVEVRGRYWTSGKNRVTTEGGTVDFGVRGGSLIGYSFLDQNRNGSIEENEGERRLEPGTLNGKKLQIRPETNDFLVEDLPFGRYELVATDYHRDGLTLWDTQSSSGLDWVTGKRVYDINENFSSAPIDILYFNPKGDLAITTPAVSPAKDVHVVGDEVDVTFQLTNKGEAPEAPTFTTGEWSKTTLSHSPGIEPRPGSYDEFTVKSPLLPGQSLDVKIRARFDSTKIEYVNALVRPSKWGDDPFADNVRRQPIKVVEKGAETTTSPASTTTTAPATTTTTTPAVAKAGDKSGLASTGASPLGFLALGALLLAAGLGAFFVARRRRS